ncbi:nucleotidyl transferase AbiEii/AbiGii toxin family protein [Listeria booriae]|uniref:nucleotidyl transferase AbiEii/AbiGii toxin family protein n=1 Tax=Listeria booriae TaxID=1552123 RepID=UPI001628007D|nr:nucleotidyl transferase AbiEii/AbiGii toxin family protein [Listeria booriae]MBC2181207.1 nucleotidyl transferase AbiEii/AbiGii toxin family protein [Listeria booriae]
MHLYENKEVFNQLIVATSQVKHLPEAVVEKDYYVSLLLRCLRDELPNLVFKGGTSLSKAYHVIQRFSEDIDLTFSVRLQNTELKKTKNTILETITLLDLRIENLDKIMSRRRFNRYEVAFDPMYVSTTLKNHLLVETFAHYTPYPVEERAISNYIYEYLESIQREDVIVQFPELAPFLMQVQSLERTFVDKIFAVLDRYLEGESEGFSRHLYDLYKMSSGSVLALDGVRALFEEVRRELAGDLKQNPSAILGFPVRARLLQLLTTDFYRKDYERITEQLVQEDVPYAVVKEKLIGLLEEHLPVG